MTALVLAIMFGWEAPAPEPGLPPVVEYRVYIDNGTTTDTYTYAESPTDDLDLPEGEYRVWVTALGEWVYTNSVNGPVTNKVESDPSDNLTFVMPNKPGKPSGLWARIKRWMLGG